MVENLKFQKLHPDVKLPARQTEGSVGYDVHAFLLTESGRPNTLVLPPRTTRNVPTGLLIEPPESRPVFVCSRSGLAAKSIWVANAPGIIDPDYRGELQILLYNGGFESYYVKHEDRIAQLFLPTVFPVAIVEVSEILPATQRGAQGFGSTGR